MCARPLRLEEMAAALAVPPAQARRVLKALQQALDADGRGIELVEVAEGYQLVSRARFFPHLRRIAAVHRRPALSAAAMETLAIVAYSQPISRHAIETVRGVSSEAALSTLVERGLVEVRGRGNGPGRPLLYGTTRRFLELFGLRTLKDLPAVLPDGRGMATLPGAQTTPDKPAPAEERAIDYERADAGGRAGSP